MVKRIRSLLLAVCVMVGLLAFSGFTASSASASAASCSTAPQSEAAGHGLGGSFTATWTNQCARTAGYAWVTCENSGAGQVGGEVHGATVTGNGTSKAACNYLLYVYHWGVYLNYNGGAFSKYTYG